MLSGGTSRIAGIVSALADRFDTEVQQFDPFRHVMIDAAALGAEQRLELAPVSAIAVGLALRHAGDR